MGRQPKLGNTDVQELVLMAENQQTVHLRRVNIMVCEYECTIKLSEKVSSSLFPDLLCHSWNEKYASHGIFLDMP